MRVRVNSALLAAAFLAVGADARLYARVLGSAYTSDSANTFYSAPMPSEQACASYCDTYRNGSQRCSGYTYYQGTCTLHDYTVVRTVTAPPPSQIFAIVGTCGNQMPTTFTDGTSSMCQYFDSTSGTVTNAARRRARRARREQMAKRVAAL